MTRLPILPAVIVCLFAAGCSSSSSGAAEATPLTDADYEKQITTGMHDTIIVQLQALHDAIVEMQGECPQHAWDATNDAQAIASLKTSWAKARNAYEQIEGAVAPIFPDIDFTLDARYDDFLQASGGMADPDPFDGTGITGLHAMERILYADVIPPYVVTFESTLPGYAAASFPTTDAQAMEFQSGLLGQALADSNTLIAQWTPTNIDLGGSFQGLIALMNEQQEKVNKAASQEEESRYSQTTLRDLRANLAGTKTVYELFQPWVRTKSGGQALDGQIEMGFTSLSNAYAADAGDAIPEPPADWQALEMGSQSAADLMTPFGVLYTTVHQAVDPAAQGSVVFNMNDVADDLGFPQFKTGK
jgi:iron uptake system component EfeO